MLNFMLLISFLASIVYVRNKSSLRLFVSTVHVTSKVSSDLIRHTIKKKMFETKANGNTPVHPVLRIRIRDPVSF
jgi:hypothetical protein